MALQTWSGFLKGGLWSVALKDFKKVRIIVRGDSAFAREPTMSWCEDQGVFYCFGPASIASIGIL
jgi:Transposase DDE domain group 1